MKLTKRNHVLLLSLICALAYFVLPASHGLTNWQEGQRALVAREMQRLGEWLVPTVNGEPYLAKPPMVYWCQLALARVRALLGGDGEVGLIDLRLTVAIAGWLGVIATYLVGRKLLLRAGRPTAEEKTLASRAAFWSAAMLATGFLYVRSSRIGELDVLIVAFVVLAIGAIFTSWRSHLDDGRMNIWASVAATVLACGAMMTKGPPALVCIACGGYGAIIAWSLFSSGEGPGVGKRIRSCFVALSRTHPVAVLGVPFGVLWLWFRAVEGRIGADAVAAAVGRQTSENLQFFVPESPINNLEAMAYGVGLGSIAAIIALIWLLRERPKLWAGAWMILAWMLLSFVAFSVMGKGVPRYLTPMWPGMALLGGMWVAHALREGAHGKQVRNALVVGVIALSLGQAWWYGIGREARYGDRSPEALLVELLKAGSGVDPSDLGAVDIWDPRLDYYTGVHVQPYEDAGPGVGVSGVEARAISELVDELRTAGGTRVLLIRERAHPWAGAEIQSPIDRLRAMGLDVERIRLESAFTVDNRKTPVIAVRVSAGG